MYKFVLQLAGLPVAVSSRYNFAADVAADYVVKNSEPVISVEASDEAITEALGYNAESTPARIAEWSCIYKEIAERLPLFDRLVVHGAAISYKGDGILFTAPSTTGKSTHIKLWKDLFKDDVEIINGDKPILQITDNKALAFGTPWPGKEGWHKNISAPLKAVCLLRRGPVNHIERIDVAEYLPQLLRQVYLPKDSEAAEKTLELFSRLVEAVPFYVLECDISNEAVMTAYKAIVEGNLETNED